MVKISISLDEDIVKLIDAERGDVPRSKYIENIIKSTGLIFDAIWIFSDEFDEVTNVERWIEAHTSQPIGKPLHKHEGFLSISGDSLHFFDKDMNFLFELKKFDINNITVEYDDIFKRFRDSRGFLPPMKIVLNNRNMYLFTKPIGKISLRGNGIYRGENEKILTWFKNGHHN